MLDQRRSRVCGDVKQQTSKVTLKVLVLKLRQLLNVIKVCFLAMVLHSTSARLALEQGGSLRQRSGNEARYTRAAQGGWQWHCTAPQQDCDGCF